MKVATIVFASAVLLANFGLSNRALAANGPYFAHFGIAPAYLPADIYLGGRGPYFAEHPPVYYSHPESRPYGLLPYPYSPATSARPVVVVNPHVPQPAEDGVTAGGPLTVVNPYVVSADGGRPPETRLPERVSVVFPTAVFADAK